MKKSLIICCISLILNSFMHGDQKTAQLPKEEIAVTFKQEMNKALDSCFIIWQYVDYAKESINNNEQQKYLNDLLLALIPSSYLEKIENDIRKYLKFLFPNKDEDEKDIELVRRLTHSDEHINQIIDNIPKFAETVKKIIEDIETQKEVIENFDIKYPSVAIKQKDIRDEDIEPWEPKDIL